VAQSFSDLVEGCKVAMRAKGGAFHPDGFALVTESRAGDWPADSAMSGGFVWNLRMYGWRGIALLMRAGFVPR
jgi:hypothetical protein